MQKIIRLIDNRFGYECGEFAICGLAISITIAIIAIERFAFWWFG